MAKESFLLYKPFYEPIKSLSDQQLGRLFRALFEYQINGKDCNDSDILMAFLFFKNQFVLDEKKYEKIVERNRNNGSKRGRNIKTDSPTGGNKTDSENIELIYTAYPTRCPIAGRNTGKTVKCKDKIRVLLKEISAEKLLETIKWYVDDCKKTGTYLKNFSTFLNNLPDMQTKIGAKDTNKICRWSCPDIGLSREGSYEQYQSDVKRNAPHKVNFLGYVE